MNKNIHFQNQSCIWFIVGSLFFYTFGFVAELLALCSSAVAALMIANCFCFDFFTFGFRAELLRLCCVALLIANCFLNKNIQTTTTKTTTTTLVTLAG